MTLKQLTKKQRLFVIEYLKDYNASKAAVRAGYSPRSAYSIGQRLLKNDEIQEYLLMYKNELFQGLQQHFIAEALTAQKVMTKILNDPNANDRDRIRVAQDFLDRAGFKPINKKEVSGTNGVAIEYVFVNTK